MDTAELLGELIGSMINEISWLRTKVDTLEKTQTRTLVAFDGLLKILEREGILFCE
jgi:hypothetical protein